MLPPEKLHFNQSKQNTLKKGETWQPGGKKRTKQLVFEILCNPLEDISETHLCSLRDAATLIINLPMKLYQDSGDRQLCKIRRASTWATEN